MSEHQYEKKPEIKGNGAEREPELIGPNIWVGSLTDHNNGVLHGEWMDAARSEHELLADIHRMLKASPLAETDVAPEEWGIFDYQNFGPIRIGEHEDLYVVSEHARCLVKHGLAYVTWYEINGTANPDDFVDAYLGEHASTTAYAESLGEEFGWNDQITEEVSSSLGPYVYIDYERLGRDMEIGGDIYTSETPTGTLWIFRS
ncbi:MAG: antirestriction protein [Subtercola sp.]|nr:antirestriction protein [Subtercola sp.]